MIIEITVDGITRTYQGDYDELSNRDWTERVQNMLDTVEAESVEEMPVMKGTLDALDKLKT